MSASQIEGWEREQKITYRIPNPSKEPQKDLQHIEPARPYRLPICHLPQVGPMNHPNYVLISSCLIYHGISINPELIHSLSSLRSDRNVSIVANLTVDLNYHSQPGLWRGKGKSGVLLVPTSKMSSMLVPSGPHLLVFTHLCGSPSLLPITRVCLMVNVIW